MLSTPSSDHDPFVVQTSGLAKRFGTRVALDGIDLEVPRGVASGFLGANGAGKTTLIRLLLGLAEPTAGRMHVLGRELPGGRSEALARVGAIIEEPRFRRARAGATDRGAPVWSRKRSEPVTGAGCPPRRFDP